VTLIGAQPRAEGVVLRFELALSTGQVLVRGEGRVVGFKPGTEPGTGGLSLRVTRLDVRSKALVDKAAALREQRRPSLRPPLPPLGSRPPPPPVRTSTPPPPRARVSYVPRPPEPPPSETRFLRRPADRDGLLDRLRARAKALDPEAVESIFEQRRRAKAAQQGGQSPQ
jgi:hypothetical protein